MSKAKRCGREKETIVIQKDIKMRKCAKETGGGDVECMAAWNN